MDQLAKDYEAVHIVFGNAAFGSLRHGLSVREKVIGFPGIFSTGPICDLHEDSGLNARHKWLESHFLFESEELGSDKTHLRDAFLAVASIPEQMPVVIWTADNAHEQTGMRLAVYLLKDMSNDIYLINTTRAAEALLDNPDWTYSLRHSGEIGPKEFQLIYESTHLNKPVSLEQLKQLEEDWVALSATREVLRVWEAGKILTVPADHYDAYLIAAARELHEESGKNNFMKSARVIGTVLGDLDQYVGDQYLEYRLRHLITNGIFEMEGVLKAMRFYSVRLR